MDDVSLKTGFPRQVEQQWYPECVTSTAGNSSSRDSGFNPCNSTQMVYDLVEDMLKGLVHGSFSDEFDIIKNPIVSTAIIIIHSFVIVLGTCGSLLVLVTVLKTRHMWNATNIFIANLALADLFVCAFDLPLTLYYQLTDDWLFGRTLCHIIPPVLATVVFSSTLTLTLIAIDRYLLIVCPLQPKISVKLALVLVVVIAITSVAAPLPIAIYAEYVEIHDSVLGINRRYCTENWPNIASRQIFTVVSLLLPFFVPLMVIAFLYYLIFSRLRCRLKTPQAHKLRTNKMLLSVVVVFALTWTPYNLYSVASEFWPDNVTGRYYKMTDLLLRVFALSSSCVNPFLYGWMNEKYRAAFAVIIKHPRVKFTREAPDDAHAHSPQKNDVHLQDLEGQKGEKPDQGTINQMAVIGGVDGKTTSKTIKDVYSLDA